MDESIITASSENNNNDSNNCISDQDTKIPADPPKTVELPSEIKDIKELYKYVNTLQITVNKTIDNYIEVWKLLNDINATLAVLERHSTESIAKLNGRVLINETEISKLFKKVVSVKSIVK